MKISASNIGWKKEYDEQMYIWMRNNGLSGLEIAPTRIFTEKPYDKCKEARIWADRLKDEYGLEISSMQSIWYGRNENIFVSKDERESLIEYTKKAIDFAKTIDCNNLVFGCPRNRNVPEGADILIAEEFFSILGEYACNAGTVIAMEANPPIYNTNYCNTTRQAIELVKRVGSPGFRLNLDIGTMIANDESIDDLDGTVDIINHVHISEPGLAMIKNRAMHSELKTLLKESAYDRYVSLEVKTQEDIQDIKEPILYIKELFAD
jgi:sugar phosphate isomerase/epimerase